MAACTIGMPMITLKPGVTLRNGTLTFGAKGVRLTRDNTLDGVTVVTAEDEVAILNLYADPVAGQAAYAEAVRAVADYTAGHMERISAQTGRAFDLAMLLGRAA